MVDLVCFVYFFLVLLVVDEFCFCIFCDVGLDVILKHKNLRKCKARIVFVALFVVFCFFCTRKEFADTEA